MSVVALLHESRDPVDRHQITAMLRNAAQQASGWLRAPAHALPRAGHRVFVRLRRRSAGPQPSPLDPLLEGGPPLPGTTGRAFWSGLIIVCLSVVSGLA